MYIAHKCFYLLQVCFNVTHIASTYYLTIITKITCEEKEKVNEFADKRLRKFIDLLSNPYLELVNFHFLFKIFIFFKLMIKYLSVYYFTLCQFIKKIFKKTIKCSWTSFIISLSIKNIASFILKFNFHHNSRNKIKHSMIFLCDKASYDNEQCSWTIRFAKPMTNLWWS